MCAFTAHTSIDYKSSNAFSVFKMIELIHNILTLYALPGLILGIGFCFLFVMIPDGVLIPHLFLISCDRGN